MELAEVIGGIFVSIFASIICFALAYLIGCKKDLSFIAGFDESSYKGDKEKLAKKAGWFLTICGIATLLLPFILMFTY